MLDLTRDRLLPVYLRYLSAAFGSAFLTSVYWVVDMAMVGQYQGPSGTAALSIVSPVWNIIISIGSLTGIGGSVLFAAGEGRKRGEGTVYFTVSIISSALIALSLWALLAFKDEAVLRASGADGELLPLALRYLFPVKCVVPVFLFNPVLAAFLRNDRSPGLATAAVVIGGVFNIFGDWFFIFFLDYGIMGAGLATGLGSIVTLSVMLTHFRDPGNTLKLEKPVCFLKRLKETAVTGFPTFFLDLALALLTVLFNHQILRYLGVTELAVYGLIMNISTFVQCSAAGVGQASQPIISANLGARRAERIREVIRYAFLTIILLGAFWLSLSLAFPEGYVRVYMKPTEEVLAVAPSAIRAYSLSFPLLLVNIFSAYCLQALLVPGAAFLLSILRGCVLSGILVLALPLVAGPGAIWYVMPLTEAAVAVFAIWKLASLSRKL